MQLPAAESFKMENQVRQTRWTGAVSAQALLSVVLLAALPRIAVASVEVDALYALRQALVDPRGVLESWDPSLADQCTWDYVFCDSGTSTIRLLLGNFSLSGSLVPEVGLLRKLQYLEIESNNITGTIPETLGDLTDLEYLDLSQNSLVGPIPEILGNLSSLRILRLSNNKLHAAIPASLTSLDNLEVLDLSFNHLSGPIPVNGSFDGFSPGSSVYFTSGISFQGNPGLYYPEEPPAAPPPDAGSRRTMSQSDLSPRQQVSTAGAPIIKLIVALTCAIFLAWMQ